MEDPLVVYIVVRGDLGMSVGKTGIQMCHSTEALMRSLLQVAFGGSKDT